MRDAADWAVELSADLPAELQGPVTHDPLWLWLALALTLAVLALVLAPGLRRRLTRTRDGAGRGRLGHRALAEINRVVLDVRAGATAPTRGHQELSRLVRDLASSLTHRPVDSMTLTDLRSDPATVEALPGLVELVTFLYVPEFAGDEDRARTAFETAAERSRTVVRSWT